MTRVGILGGSFNPAHGGHRRLSLAALHRLRLDAVWWLVSPQNPLKRQAGMAPFVARLASARAVARHPRIRVTDIEAGMRTRFTADTLAKLVHCHPHIRFIWLMGADNLAGFHRWERWRALAHTLPIAVFARPGYVGDALRSPAASWFGARRHRAAGAARWPEWPTPALVVLPMRLDPRSATAIRAAEPGWAERLAHPRVDRPPANPRTPD